MKQLESNHAQMSSLSKGAALKMEVVKEIKNPDMKTLIVMTISQQERR